MNRYLDTCLDNARELKQSEKFSEALEIFEKQYQIRPDEFTHQDRVDYAWTIIKVRMSDSAGDEEFFSSADFITEILPQSDLTRRRSCPCTTAVFKVLIRLKDDGDYFSMGQWLLRLDPELLDVKRYRSHGIIQKPRKEKWYDWASKCRLENMEYEECIEVSKTALETLKSFMHDGDTWFRYRIAKSLMELGRLSEALDYYLEVIKVKHDWYMYRDIAEIYCRLSKPWTAQEYLCPAVLSSESDKVKADVYRLCFKVFERSNPEIALKHAELFYLIRKQNGHSIPHDIEMLEIDETQLKKKELKAEIRHLWMRYKYKNHKLHHGTVKKFIEEKGFGFIRDENDDEIFFHKSEFEGDTVFTGQMVSFFTEENFDRSKNRKSVKAVYIRGE